MKRIYADPIQKIRSYIRYSCPLCGEEMRLVYVMDVRYCCLKCNKVWELWWKESKETIQEVKDDGWLKEIKEGEK